MAITVGILGEINTTAGGVEKVTFDIDAWKDGGTKDMSIEHTLFINCSSGDWSYQKVGKNATAPTMTNPDTWTPVGAGGANDTIIPPLSFNPVSQDLYIKSTASSTFSIST